MAAPTVTAPQSPLNLATESQSKSTTIDRNEESTAENVAPSRALRLPIANAISTVIFVVREQTTIDSSARLLRQTFFGFFAEFRLFDWALRSLGPTQVRTR